MLIRKYPSDLAVKICKILIRTLPIYFSYHCALSWYAENLNHYFAIYADYRCHIWGNTGNIDLQLCIIIFFVALRFFCECCEHLSLYRVFLIFLRLFKIMLQLCIIIFFVALRYFCECCEHLSLYRYICGLSLPYLGQHWEY
jgi:hypothetical protein